MKKILLSASALVAIAALPGLAAAQTTPGWYGSASAGYSLDGGVDFDAPLNPTGAGQSPYMIGHGAKGDGGWGGAAALGYSFNNGFRLETELAQGHAGFANEGVSSVLGSATTWTAMLNGLYDFNRGGTINPFVGAGVGMGRVKTKAFSYDQANASNPLLALSRASAANVSDTDSGFAWQLIAGLGLKLTDQLAADLSYKWVNIPDLSFAGTGRYRTNATGGSATAPINVGGTVGGGLGSGGVVGLGLRYAFAAPAAPVAPPAPPPPPPPPMTPVEPAPPVVVEPAPPPPPPPPAVCAGKSFVVYFDHDKSFLTDEAKSVITNEVQDITARSCNYRSVLLQGHADLSGNPRYNIGLSQRRVTIVRDALVGQGVPADLMTGEAFGETKPAVATADGVKEPLNRRTEVTFDFQ